MCVCVCVCVCVCDRSEDEGDKAKVREDSGNTLLLVTITNCTETHSQQGSREGSSVARVGPFHIPTFLSKSRSPWCGLYSSGRVVAESGLSQSGASCALGPGVGQHRPALRLLQAGLFASSQPPEGSTGETHRL